MKVAPWHGACPIRFPARRGYEAMPAAPCTSDEGDPP